MSKKTKADDSEMTVSMMKADGPTVSKKAKAEEVAASRKAKADKAAAGAQAAAASTESLGVHWSVSDRDLLYNFFLDSDHDKNFGTLKKNRNHVFDKVCGH